MTKSTTAQVKLEVAPMGNNSHLEVDGVNFDWGVRAVKISTEVGKLSKMIIEYACVEAAVDGEVQIIHNCPQGLLLEEEE